MMICMVLLASGIFVSASHAQSVASLLPFGQTLGQLTVPQLNLDISLLMLYKQFIPQRYQTFLNGLTNQEKSEIVNAINKMAVSSTTAQGQQQLQQLLNNPTALLAALQNLLPTLYPKLSAIAQDETKRYNGLLPETQKFITIVAGAVLSGLQGASANMTLKTLQSKLITFYKTFAPAYSSLSASAKSDLQKNYPELVNFVQMYGPMLSFQVQALEAQQSLMSGFGK